MPAQAETACYRCREQKLKCSRQRPTCDRCSRLGSECAFPAPPDRKLLAAHRASPKRRRLDDRATATASAALAFNADPAARSSTAVDPDPPSFVPSRAAHAGGQTCDAIVGALPRSLQRIFVEVYFSHMYNASLTFHQPTFLEAFETGAVASHVLVAIFATATIFLKPPSPTWKRHRQELGRLGDVGETGRLWAQVAGREALQTIDTPCLANIRTCQMIALYWFSAGQSVKNTMFSGIAYKGACVLGLNQSPSGKDAGVTSDSDENAWVEAETRRRLFWATWLTNCINSEHYTVGTSVNDLILSLPLPMDDMDFQKKIRRHGQDSGSICLGGSSSSSTQPCVTTSIMAELVRLMRIWAAVGDYVAAQSKQSTSQRLAEFCRLEQLLSTWCKNLHPSVTYSKRNLYKQLVVDQQPTYIFVHALYHQCWLALHISMVPQFSGLPVGPTISPALVTASAMVALKHARAVSRLCTDLIALDWDIHRVAPFVGYCIYVSASIHIVFLFLKNERLANLARMQLASNLRVLRGMKPYWSNLDRLWARISILYEAQTSTQKGTTRTASEPGTNDTRDEDDDIEDLEQGSEEMEISALASKSRDTGALQEPLANSTLKYSVGTPVQSTAAAGTHPAMSSLQGIEQIIYTDVLGRLANRDIAGRGTQQQQPPQRQQAQDQYQYYQSCPPLDMPIESSADIHNAMTVVPGVEPSFASKLDRLTCRCRCESWWR
ncbi:Transcription factor [Niveomyces insectorum RCEF 264]|uniref:Transcription factor n=1 Tax=Niveomyces insectorum RCEF 264 TaxID=1081102 RepID=A0A167Z0N1_9HYPO|nr:Transcription factor [Niveomyces insectorum RCEF 264]